MNKDTATDTLETDVLIAGAGMAGYAAAIAAAEWGQRVILVEQHDAVGGAATLSNVGTLCGLYYRGAEALPVQHPFFPSFSKRLKKACPQIETLSLPQGLHVISYDKAGLNNALRNHLLEHGIQVTYGAKIIDTQTDGSKIASVTFLKDNIRTIRAKSFIDCTGHGALASQVRHPMLRSSDYQAAAQIMRLENIKTTTEYALNLSLRKVMRETQEQETWPAAYMRLSVVPGSLRNDTVDLKLPLTEQITDDDALTDRLKAEVRKNLPRLLKTIEKIESLCQASVSEIAPVPGVRLQQRPQGQYVLTHDDVMQCAKPLDGIALGTWPIEEWDYDGKVNMEYFAEKDGYLIPARCLQSPVFDNLHFAGKGISADDKAIASARVTGTCLQTGYTAGKLAACSRNQDQEAIIRKMRIPLARKR